MNNECRKIYIYYWDPSYLIEITLKHEQVITSADFKDIITHPFSNVNGGIAEPHLKLRMDE